MIDKTTTAAHLFVRREALRVNENMRHEAVAMFPLRVANMASDLKRMVDSKMQGEGHELLDESIRYLSKKIQNEFLETFGHSMIMD